MSKHGQKPRPRVSPAHRHANTRRQDTVRDLIREGVERFILKDAAILSFQQAVHAAARQGKHIAHPLTSLAFRRIVRDAVRERARRTERRARTRATRGKGNTP